MSATTQVGHTPGPWALVGEVGPMDVSLLRYHWKVGQAESPNRGVALVFGDTEANARLIAAAPEMLRALRDVVGRYEGVQDLPHYVRVAQAAIAKVEGK